MEFINELAVKVVRKARPCAACSTTVQVGDSAVSWAGKVDGEFGFALYHPECRQAEMDLNKLHGTHLHAADWFGLDDIEPDDHEWLLEKHPVVAARMGITSESIKEYEEQCSLRRRSLITAAVVGAPS
ncbi:hypothetical protein [Erythrobacter aureus]|uniref:Uncharacterized protein n=1 Tax=Erythrobacter aureus TaxID=2182384 RepID=A0A345YIY1_9SPHN|nr:hypothetical protein [Erythrobacter aureus]AXK43883.1 hypothetical protein DVR09_15625 [Erythrobacter aureus]